METVTKRKTTTYRVVDITAHNMKYMTYLNLTKS